MAKILAISASGSPGCLLATGSAAGGSHLLGTDFIVVSSLRLLNIVLTLSPRVPFASTSRPLARGSFVAYSWIGIRSSVQKGVELRLLEFLALL